MPNNIRERFNHFRNKQFQILDIQQLQAELLTESTLDSSYLILVIGSCAIATFGLLSNSTAVIIGALLPLRL